LRQIEQRAGRERDEHTRVRPLLAHGAIESHGADAARQVFEFDLRRRLRQGQAQHVAHQPAGQIEPAARFGGGDAFGCRGCGDCVERTAGEQTESKHDVFHEGDSALFGWRGHHSVARRPVASADDSEDGSNRSTPL
jgi:hypothetical protein